MKGLILVLGECLISLFVCKLMLGSQDFLCHSGSCGQVDARLHRQDGEVCGDAQAAKSLAWVGLPTE